MTPGVSVVVPVFDAGVHLDTSLRAILSQDYPADRWEAIYVDNGSRDGSRALLDRHCARIRVLSAQRRGASAARNAGIRAARFDLIAFTDADCEPAGDWLRELVAAAGTADFVGGRITARDPRTRVAAFAETLMDQRSALGYHPPYAITANLLARRELLLELGLFDEDLLRGQDVDLSYRAFERGASFGYAPRAVVGHAHPETLSGLWRKGLQHGRAAADVLRKHAGLAGQTPGRRCRDLRRYSAILVDTWQGLAWAWRARQSGEAAARSAMYDSWCRAVFNAGRQAGLVQATVSCRWSKRL